MNASDWITVSYVPEPRGLVALWVALRKDEPYLIGLPVIGVLVQHHYLSAGDVSKSRTVFAVRSGAQIIALPDVKHTRGAFLDVLAAEDEVVPANVERIAAELRTERRAALKAGPW